MFRTRLALVLTLLLAACGPAGTHTSFTDTRMPPHLSRQFWAPDGWAWGVVQIKGRPSLRYGVVTPPGMSAGQVIIMTGYGETAEGWFETARFLVDHDYSVWVLEAAGQGGSGRYGAPHDQGQAPDFTADIEGVRALSAAVIRPRSTSPVSLIASGTAAPAAIVALSQGLSARALILSSPGDAAVPRGAGGWTRPANLSALSLRQREQLGWMIANPDLRMGGPNQQWRTAWSQAQANAVSPVVRARFSGDVLVVSPTAKPLHCSGFRQCKTRQIAASVPYQLADDATLQAWRRAVLEGLGADHGP